MKSKLITIAAALALAVILARVFEKPLLAQIRAALTQNVDEPGRNPFAISMDATAGFGQVVVPAGKRYVIENFSADCAVPSSTSMSTLKIAAQYGGTVVHASAPAYLEAIQSNLWTATGMTRLYADAGPTLSMEVRNAGGGEAGDSCSLFVSGYVINNP